MRDRLTKLISECSTFTPEYAEQARLHAEYVAQHLLNEGVIVLPVNVGQEVYYPSFSVGMVFSYKVISIKLNSKGLYIVIDNRLRNEQLTHRATQIGKTIFLTKEEAEKALERGEG